MPLTPRCMSYMMPKLMVDLGAGLRCRPGWVGIDRVLYPGIIHVLDLEHHYLPFQPGAVDAFRASHLFEHLSPEGLFHLLNECWKALKPSGYLFASVPRGDTPAFYVHPGHRIHFVEDTFAFFQVPSGGIDPHGALSHFWHVSIKKGANPQEVRAVLRPNKPGNPRFPFQEVRLKDYLSSDAQLKFSLEDMDAAT
jgi:SAM-dependent methyltransferase